MAITDYFVDPAAALDSGTGTVGSPWGPRTGGKCALQHALDTITRDATNGDRILVKAGTSDVMGAALSFATYGSSGTATAPLVIQGYTAVANDGGVGSIDGNALYGISASAQDYTHFIDMEVFNVGNNSILVLDDNCLFLGCHLHGSTKTSGSVVGGDNNMRVVGCHIHDIVMSCDCNSGLYLYNLIETDSASQNAIVFRVGGSNSEAVGNVVRATVATSAQLISGAHRRAIGNTVIAPAGSTGAGIKWTNNAIITLCVNNVVSGFSGVGGSAFNFGTGVTNHLFLANAYYNCAAALGAAFTTVGRYVAPELLGSDPYTDLTTIQPSDVGGMLGKASGGGAWPQLMDWGDASPLVRRYVDLGGVQDAPSAGGGGGIIRTSPIGHGR